MPLPLPLPQTPRFVKAPCQPYPIAAYPDNHGDYRRTQWLTKVIDGLTLEELRTLTRVLLNLHPRLAEQQLALVGHQRALDQWSDHTLTAAVPGCFHRPPCLNAALCR